MDATRFDDLIKRLATTRLTRLQTLRELAAGGVAALTGITLGSKEARAKKKNEKKVKVCKCPTADATTCKTAKIKKSKAKKVAKKACNYKGKCRAGVVGSQCTVVPTCSNNTQCTGGQVCVDGRCVNCTADQQCGGGLVCLSGTCQTPVTPPQCQNNNQCTGANAGRVCVGGNCVDCNFESNVNQCDSGQICQQNGRCGGGETCTPAMTDPCVDPFECLPAIAGGNRCQLGPSQGFGNCPPITASPANCPIIAGIQTQCVLGRCVVPCDEDVECQPNAQGSCRSGFCIKNI